MSAEERIFRALADPQRQEALATLLENIEASRTSCSSCRS